MVVSFADVELDVERRELRRGGELVPLEPQVFDVLAYLVRHRGRVVTKEELLDEVWGNRFVSESALTSRIKSARRAVGDSGRDQRVIRTFHRRGFRLVADVRDGPGPAGRSPPGTAGVAPEGDGDGDDPRAVPLPAAAGPAAPLPFLGRDADVRAVTAAVEPGRAVVLVGEAGVGKSRLVAEVARGWPGPTLFARADVATRSVPFGALAALLPAEVARIGNGDRLAVLGALAVEFERRAGSVLVIDDAHSLDELSAAVVQHAVGAGTLAVLASARRGIELPDGLERLRVDGRVRFHEVAPLDEPASRTLVEATLGGPVEPVTQAELWRISRGNPLLLREVVVGAVDRETLRLVDDRWTAAGPLVGGERLVDVIRSRYVGLSDRARRGLEVVAVAGSIPLPQAEELLGAETLEDLERVGALAVDVDRRRHTVRFAHPLHAEAIDATLGVVARRRAARLLAEHLERTGPRRREDEVRLALWRLQAGQRPDVGLIARAAELALGFYDYVGAEALAQAAWDATGTAECAVVLAEARFQQGFTHEVEDLLSGVDLARADDRVRTGLAVRRASNLVWGLGRPEVALEVNAAASALVGAQPWHDELTAHRATLLVAAGDPHGALALARPLAEHPSPRVRIEARYACGRALLLAGHADEARRVARGGYADHVAVEGEIGVGHPAIHLVTYAQALLAVGRVEEAHRLGTTLLDGSRDARMNVGETWAGLILGGASLLAGRVDEASTRFDTVVALARRCGQLGHLVMALSSSAAVRALRGEVGAAADVLAELEALPVLTEHRGDVVRARAWVAAAGGRTDEACGLLRQAAEAAEASGQGWAEAALRHDLVRLGAPREAVARLGELAARGGRLVEVQAQHAAAAAAADPAGLAQAADGFAALGAALLSAECARAEVQLLEALGDHEGLRAATARLESREPLRGPAFTVAGRGQEG